MFLVLYYRWRYKKNVYWFTPYMRLRFQNNPVFHSISVGGRSSYAKGFTGSSQTSRHFYKLDAIWEWLVKHAECYLGLVQKARLHKQLTCMRVIAIESTLQIIHHYVISGFILIPLLRFQCYMKIKGIGFNICIYGKEKMCNTCTVVALYIPEKYSNPSKVKCISDFDGLLPFWILTINQNKTRTRWFSLQPTESQRP